MTGVCTTRSTLPSGAYLDTTGDQWGSQAGRKADRPTTSQPSAGSLAGRSEVGPATTCLPDEPAREELGVPQVALAVHCRAVRNLHARVHRQAAASATNTKQPADEPQWQPACGPGGPPSPLAPARRRRRWPARSRGPAARRRGRPGSAGWGWTTSIATHVYHPQISQDPFLGRASPAAACLPACLVPRLLLVVPPSPPTCR